MHPFLLLTARDGKPLLVHANWILWVSPEDPGSILRVTAGDCYFDHSVRESVEVISAMLAARTPPVQPS